MVETIILGRQKGKAQRKAKRCTTRRAQIEGESFIHIFSMMDIVVTYEIRVFFEGAQKEVFSSIF